LWLAIGFFVSMPERLGSGPTTAPINENPAFSPFFAWHEKSLLEYSASFAHCALR
jgi:hypothetical protein